MSFPCTLRFVPLFPSYFLVEGLSLKVKFTSCLDRSAKEPRDHFVSTSSVVVTSTRGQATHDFLCALWGSELRYLSLHNRCFYPRSYLPSPHCQFLQQIVRGTRLHGGRDSTLYTHLSLQDTVWQSTQWILNKRN